MDPASAQCTPEMHQFGYVLAILSIVAFSLGGAVCCCVCCLFGAAMSSQ